MHLHSMTLEALGPFAGRHTIDFAELGASGLFLLEGPTGAGKSTIIDAIVFALYGKVASQDASEDRLRSDHAHPDQETVVDLVLESGSGVYRVRRTPRYERPKQRGTGTTTQQATVKLWRLASPEAEDGELLSNRLDEAGAELQRIVGLDRSQFVQTIVLPQGEFASFLRANPEDRRGLLQKVFGTVVYEQLQQRLERLRADVGRSLEEARQAVARSGARFVGAAGLADDDAAGLLTASQAVTAASGPGGADGLAAIEKDAGRAEGIATLAQQQSTGTRSLLEQGRVLAAAVDRRATLRGELAVLTGAAVDHEHRLGRREAARRAQAALPLVTGSEQATEAVRRAERRAAGARVAAPVDLHEVIDAFTEIDIQRKTLVVERDRCTALRATLVRLAELETGLPAWHGQITAAEGARAGKAAERGRRSQELGARPARRVALTDELAEVTGVAAGLAAWVERSTAAEVRLAAAEDVTRLTREVEGAQTSLAEAATEARQAVLRAADVQQARITGIAGELAQHLVAGAPCAVCGGTEHPSPATAGPDQVTVEDVEEAEAARVGATAALGEASEALGALRVALEGRRVVAGADEESARAQLKAARAGVTAAQGALLRQKELEAELTRFDAATAQLESQVAGLAAELASEDARLVGLRGQVDRDEAEVTAARDGAASVRERVRALTERTRLVTAWIDALSEVEDAAAQDGVRAAELAVALAEHGFGSAAAVRQATLPTGELAALDRTVSQYESALARVTAGLAEPEIAALPDDVVVDLPALRSAHGAAEAEAAQRASVAAGLRQRVSAGSAAFTELQQAVGTFTALDLESGPVVRMANLAAACGGDNAEQLTLATYVLARRFEDVVAAANVRLVTLSDGRYELVHSTGREDVRARKRGLALKVMDHRTGVDRDPRTLSGGETFYVSLCLALGLADVVTAEAGGIDLGTLFVDEGFGSLDPETLDVVLAELGRLREGGRVVGVVSHVEALKQSIAERIEVRRLPDGSSTLAVRA